MADYTAASAAYADVATQLALAGPGDRVLVPAGTATWATAFNIGANVTLEGAGLETIISTTVSATLGTIRLVNGSKFKNARIIGNASAPFGIAAGSQGWRISGVVYTSTAANSYFLNITDGAETWGLIDSCDITGPGGSSELIFTRGPSDAWNVPATLGTDQAVYIEDCIFRGTGYISDFNSNAKGVIRRCIIVGGLKADLHGVASNTPARSGRHMEVYENTWSAVGFYTSIEHRGGLLMCFNNTNTATASNFHGVLKLNEYGLDASQYGNFPTNQTLNDYPIRDQVGRGMYSTPDDWETATPEPCYLWGNRRGASAWGVHFDNIASTTRVTNSASYSAGATQITFTGTAKIGVGTSFKLPGFATRYVVTVGRNQGSSAAVTIDPPLVDAFTGPLTVTVGALQNYKHQQANESASFTESQVIAADRDYFNETAGAGGDSGVKVGTRAQMDAVTPTLEGAGWWVTDEGSWNTTKAAGTSGRLYRCVDGAWELYYTPYIYPHPLRGTLVAPAIVTQPEDRVVLEGEPTSFTMSASGNPAPSYQWKKGGVPISGEVDQTLSFAATTGSEEGTYTCTATNSEGEATTDGVTLTVNPPLTPQAPVITQQPLGGSYLEGATIDLTTAVNAWPEPTYQWKKNGADIVGATASTLSLTSVTPTVSGSYTCTIENSAGTVITNAAVITISLEPIEDNGRPYAPTNLRLAQ